MAQITIESVSRAHDGALLASADVAVLAGELDVSYRLIGGNAVSMLTLAYGVYHQTGGRETADADFGVTYDVAADPRLLPALLDHGYTQVEGNRFRRVRVNGDDEAQELVIDVLTPGYTDKLRTSQPRGDLVVDEVPGLALALAGAGVSITAEMHLTTGEHIAQELVLPGPVPALCLKAYAYDGRKSHRDVFDIWRLLEVANAAGITSDAWPDHGAKGDARRIVQRLVETAGGAGLVGMPLRAGAVTRMRALAARVLGTP